MTKLRFRWPHEIAIFSLEKYFLYVVTKWDTSDLCFNRIRNSNENDFVCRRNDLTRVWKQDGTYRYAFSVKIIISQQFLCEKPNLSKYKNTNKPKLLPWSKSLFQFHTLTIISSVGYLGNSRVVLNHYDVSTQVSDSFFFSTIH